MQNNELLIYNDTILRVLHSRTLSYGGEEVLVLDCVNLTMPKWYPQEELNNCEQCSRELLSERTHIVLTPVDELDAEDRSFAYKRYTRIACVLPFIGDEGERCRMIAKAAETFGVSKQCIRRDLCLYLAYCDISALAPKKRVHVRPLTKAEKDIRWALNKFYYTRNKNSLNTAYTMMLRERYCDASGELLPNYPSIHQFKYYYRTHKKLQTCYITRDGIKDYQRNNRPLIGDGIRSFAPAVGTGMLDSTVCDIYLVNEEGNLVGRPILSACIDAYSGLCCGYALTLEGGLSSLRVLMNNVLADKVKWCKNFGIDIERSKWDCSGVLPGLLVTDMGHEYASSTFEQLTELGITITNLPAYRPELKGAVEKFFDIIQGYFKPQLRGMGVINPDFLERGARDYRKDARLTLRQFEQIIIRCIIYYNSSRIIDNYPYTDEMLEQHVHPYASSIWNWGRKCAGANLVSMSREMLTLTLLSRTTGVFSRSGLVVNKLRYHHDGFTESYLRGGKAIVAYDPENVSAVWLVEKGQYIRFDLIERRFADKSMDAVNDLKKRSRRLATDEEYASLRAKLELAEHIRVVSETARGLRVPNTAEIRKARKKEILRQKSIDTKRGLYDE